MIGFTSSGDEPSAVFTGRRDEPHAPAQARGAQPLFLSLRFAQLDDRALLQALERIGERST